VSDVDTAPLIATCARGTEKVVRLELKKLGVTSLQSGPGSVTGTATAEAFARANVTSRCASRILRGLTTVHAPTEDALVEQLTAFAFEDLIGPRDTFAVMATLRGAPVTHTLHAARRVKDAVVDRMRAVGRGRPDVDTRRPTLRLFLFWEGETASLSLDTSGEPLHKRGYRAAQGEAPMRETLAAAILGMGHADVREPFHDPCCGSGTLGIEHVWRCLDRAPGLKRRFAIDQWRDDRFGLKAPLSRAREEAHDALREKPKAPVVLTDWHKDAIAACEACVEAAGVAEHVTIARVDARKATYAEGTTVVSNLPFGERLGKQQLQLDGFYRTLGERLGALHGSRILLFTSHPDAEYLLNLRRPTKRWSLYSGPLKAMLRRWDIPADGSDGEHDEVDHEQPSTR
jgi:23S rRNA G2445 N2-methylase RlmL